MIRQICSGVLIASFGLSIVACNNKVVGGEAGYLRDRTGEYVKGESMSPLTMPPGVVQLPPDPYYTIPSIPNANGVAVTMIPPGSALMKKTKEKAARSKKQLQTPFETEVDNT